MLDFSTRTVLVTGATRGLGRAIAEAFLQAGARVVGTYLSNRAAAEQFLESARSAGWRLELHAFDVGNYDEVERFYRLFDGTGLELDVLVNNSGIRKDGVLAMMSRDNWEDVLRTNLGGTYNMSKFAIQRMMRRRFGRIINISSPMSRVGFAGQANYAASKAGQEGMTRSMSKEVATRGITVNCVSPGFIDTDLLADLDEEKREAYRALIPMKRFGRPQEVAEAVLFLASEHAAYVTGTVLEVSGGL